MFRFLKDRFHLIFQIILLELCLIISIPFTFIFLIILIALGLIFIASIFPRELYRTYQYREIIVNNLEPEKCEAIQHLLDFYKSHKDCSSKLIIDCVQYIDYIYSLHPQQYVKYRFEFCVFLGNLCKEAVLQEMKTNHDLFDYLKDNSFEKCRDPKRYWGELKIDDIRIFKDSAVIEN